MLIGKVRGTVVSSTKSEYLNGLKLLVVGGLDPDTLTDTGEIEVVVDAVDAGDGEVVMCCRGSSSRKVDGLENYPIDYTVVAVLDSIEENGKVIYKKFSEGGV
ncbi:MAG: EutN/CcmL family microcompartment protein [Christensenella sp.]|uniref:EutN/CcmL family microcompartment protein n=1 Tax=Christensenella sp. TaxID=1935934 RepID=UPI002B21C93F|nr:EutN/CcmL family microcompartment protein [Christensenella sp.]MEA5001908.1 EutN/CcmL family microcompartment protein [Christensenella sp.]